MAAKGGKEKWLLLCGMDVARGMDILITTCCE
jgi:hypothetical protein